MTTQPLPTYHPPLRRKLRNRMLGLGIAAALAAINAPVVTAVANDAVTRFEQSQLSYRVENGAWQIAELPEEYRLNAVHSVLLATGKVLIVAGSGNDVDNFAAGTFSTTLWDPAENTYKKIHTPEDLFCGGHAFLPNGNVLIAGGTKKYEVLQEEVDRAAGVITVHNDYVYEQAFLIKKGDLFTDDVTGLKYAATEDVTIPPVHKMADGTKHPTETDIWVEAMEESEDYVFENEGRQFSFDKLDVPGFYGLADTVTLKKQEYRGLEASYEFDIRTEEYVQTQDLNVARWYPSLVSIEGGDILAVSGLDEFGVFIGEGKGETVERYDIEDKTWTLQPDLDLAFPTYPALFRGEDGNILYSGSSTGYGKHDYMRTPGRWNLADNSFTPIEGLRDPEMNETSSSVMLPPAQDQKVLFVGGGSVGEREGSTARADVIDFKNSVITPAPDLAAPVRYPSTVILPNDQVLITGGSEDYRGRFDSNVLAAQLYDPASNTMDAVAPPHVGRNYHSIAILLPDGRVLTAGSDSLYGDAENLTAGTFEQRMEIYSPPYMFAEDRPAIGSATEKTALGGTIAVDMEVGEVAEARLVRPSAVTHVTDTEQRSVELTVSAHHPGTYELTVPENENIAPLGWYMLFVTDERGVPSESKWVHIG